MSENIQAVATIPKTMRKSSTGAVDCGANQKRSQPSRGPGQRRGHRAPTGVVKNGISRHGSSSGPGPGWQVLPRDPEKSHAHRHVSAGPVLGGRSSARRPRAPVRPSAASTAARRTCASDSPSTPRSRPPTPAGSRRRCRPRARPARRRCWSRCAGSARRRPTPGRGRWRQVGPAIVRSPPLIADSGALLARIATSVSTMNTEAASRRTGGPPEASSSSRRAPRTSTVGRPCPGWSHVPRTLCWVGPRDPTGPMADGGGTPSDPNRRRSCHLQRGIGGTR